LSPLIPDIHGSWPGGFDESKSDASLELAWFKKDVAQRVDELAFLYTNIRLRHQRDTAAVGRMVPSYLPRD
jgi:hypothetical protein